MAIESNLNPRGRLYFYIAKNISDKKVISNIYIPGTTKTITASRILNSNHIFETTWVVTTAYRQLKFLINPFLLTYITLSVNDDLKTSIAGITKSPNKTCYIKSSRTCY